MVLVPRYLLIFCIISALFAHEQIRETNEMKINHKKDVIDMIWMNLPEWYVCRNSFEARSKLTFAFKYVKPCSLQKLWSIFRATVLYLLFNEHKSSHCKVVLP